MLLQSDGVREGKKKKSSLERPYLYAFISAFSLGMSYDNYLSYDLVSECSLEAELWRTLTEFSSSAFHICTNSHSVE